MLNIGLLAQGAGRQQREACQSKIKHTTGSKIGKTQKAAAIILVLTEPCRLNDTSWIHLQETKI